MHPLLKTFVCAVIVFSLIAMAFLPVLTPRQKARAVTPTFDVGLNPLFLLVEKILLPIIKVQALKMLQDLVVTWATGGKVSPKWITNWLRHLGEEVLGVSLGSILQDIGLSNICSPFGIQLRVAILAPPPRPFGQNFPSAASCTLDQIVSNIEDFYNDFTKGGFLAFEKSWEPQNNFYGSLILWQNELENRAAAQAQSRQNEGIAGSGALGIKVCLNQTIVAGEKICREWKITTPGTILAQNLAEAAGISDFDLIINAHELMDLLAYVIDAMITRLIKAGVQGLLGVATPSVGGAGVSAEEICAGLEGSEFGQCVSAVGTSTDHLATVTPPPGSKEALTQMANQMAANFKEIINPLSQLSIQYAAYQNILLNLKQCQIAKGQSTALTDQALASIPTTLAAQLLEAQNNLTKVQAIQQQIKLAIGPKKFNISLIQELGTQLLEIGGGPGTINQQSASLAAELEQLKTDISKAQADLTSCEGI